MACLGLEIQELEERSPKFVLDRLWQLAQVRSKERIVPRQDLVDQRVAITRQVARASRNSHTQRECGFRDDPRGEWEHHRARMAGLAEFGGLDGDARPLLARLCPYARLEIDDIDVPAT